MFAFPIGRYSESVEFMQLLGYISSIDPELPDKVVSNLAMSAGFYNLSHDDVSTIVGYMRNGDQNPTQTFLAENSMNLTPPRYIEILSALPIYGDKAYANVIMELGYKGN